jgi:hypothetical protein
MKLNALQGFWNGSPVPLGYVLVEVEKRGTKIKKTLAIDPVDSETIRLEIGDQDPGFHCRLPLRGGVLSLRKLGDIGPGVFEGDQLASARQRNRFIELAGP